MLFCNDVITVSNHSIQEPCTILLLMCEERPEVDRMKLMILDPAFPTVFSFCAHFVFIKYARPHLLLKSSIFSYPFECLGQPNTVLYFHTYQE